MKANAKFRRLFSRQWTPAVEAPVPVNTPHPLSAFRFCPSVGNIGFTLMELLVAMAVLSLILIVTLQVLTNAGKAIKISDSQREAASAARGALDRFAADFSTAMLTGGATAIFFNDTSTADGQGSQLGFLCLSRTRSGGAITPRAAIIAYATRPATETVSGQSVTYGCLHRGDGQSLYNGANSDLADAFENLPSPSQPPKWEPMGSGVVRFHVSFVLDDGSIVQDPPEYTMISPQNGNPTTFLNGKALAPGRKAVAFSSAHAPASGRYVKSLIVAVACADPVVLAQASSAGHLGELQSGLGTPPDGETPLAHWQKNLAGVTFPPLRQSLRFYQRTISVP